MLPPMMIEAMCPECRRPHLQTVSSDDVRNVIRYSLCYRCRTARKINDKQTKEKNEQPV